MPGRTREALNQSAMSHVATINGMIARRTTQVVLDVRSQGVQHNERPFMLQPIWALALRAACYVRLLVKGITINISPLLNPLPLAGEEAIVPSPASGGKLERGLAFRAFHPAKPGAWSCGTGSWLPKRYAKMRLIIFGHDTCP